MWGQETARYGLPDPHGKRSRSNLRFTVLCEFCLLGFRLLCLDLLHFDCLERPGKPRKQRRGHTAVGGYRIVRRQVNSFNVTLIA